jgi:hypothetical protein
MPEPRRSLTTDLQPRYHNTRLWIVRFRHPSGKIERTVAAEHIADVLAFASQAIGPMVNILPADLSIIGIRPLSEDLCPVILLPDAPAETRVQ